MVEGTSATTVGTRTRWTRWTGYVAFAWGTLFAAQHLCWFLAGRFGQGSTVQDTWSATLSGIFSVLLFGLLALFPLALVWPFCWIGERRLQIALLAASYVTSRTLSTDGPRSRPEKHRRKERTIWPGEAGGTTGIVSGVRTPPGTWTGYAAFAWTVVFVALHVYWFAGGRIGFGDAHDPIPDPPSSVAGLAFNVAALAMFVAGLVVPLALVRPWGQRFLRRMLLVLAWLGSGVLAARGGAGIVDSLLRVAGVLPRGLTGLTYEQILGQAHPSAYTLWSGAAIDTYFLIGGVLFGAAAWCYGRKQFRTPKNAG